MEKMKVFVSHKLIEENLLKSMVAILKKWDYEPLFSEEKIINGYISEKLKRLMDESEFAIILYTKLASESQTVNQEIGYLTKSGKPIFVLKGEDVNMNGFLYGYDSIILNKNKNTDIKLLKPILDDYKFKIERKEFVKSIVAGTVLGVGLSLLFNHNDK